MAYDLNVPPFEEEIGTFIYKGPKTSICGPPVVDLQDADGTSLSDFLKAEFIDDSIVISIVNNTAIVGIFNVVAAFVNPGVHKIPLGIELTITATDVCNFTTIATGGTYQKMIYNS